MSTIDLQITKFVNKHTVIAEPKTISRVMDLYKEHALVPSTLFEVELGPSGPINRNRISLSSENGDFILSLGAERIDAFFNFTNIRRKLSEAAKTANELIEIFNKVDENMEWDGTRLAYNIREQVSYSSGKSETMYEVLVNPIQSYAPLETIEWGTLQNRRVKWDNEGSPEELNVFLRVNGLFDGSKKLPPQNALMHIDINTIQENTSPRFRMLDIQRFLIKAEETSLGIFNQVKTKLGV